MLKWSSTDSSVSITTEDKYSGSKSIKIQHSSPTGNSWAESQTVIPVRKGQSYTISALIKTDFDTVGADGAAFFHYYTYDEKGNYLSHKTSKGIKKDTDWTKYVEVIKADFNGYIKLRGAELYHASGKVYFDNIRFSHGTGITQTEYDAKNNYVTKVVNQLGNEINYAYTPDGVSDPYGISNYGNPLKVTTASGEVTNFSYDGQHNLKGATDNAGNVASYTLDTNGNVTEVLIKENGTNPVYKSSFVYDKYGNMVKEVATPNLALPGTTYTTEYLYDESGRLTGKVNPGSSKTNPSISLGYEFYGLDSLKIQNGPEYKFDYNLEGQTTKEELYNNSGVMTGEFGYTYDKIGRLETLTEKEGTTDITTISKPTGQEMYDQNDRLNGFDLKYRTVFQK